MVTRREGVVERHTVMASEFKKHCLALLERVAETRVPIVVTKRGRPIAQLVPLEDDDARPLDGSVTLLAEDDAAYFSTGEDWNAATSVS